MEQPPTNIIQVPINEIAAYLATATSLRPTSPPEDYREANRLLVVLATVLPAPLFRAVRNAALSGDPEAIFEAVIAIRAVIQTLGSLEMEDAGWHITPGDLRRLN